MGLDVQPQLIVGIELDEIVEYKTIENKYELHDTRSGEPTGKFETETQKLMICGDRQIDITKGLYIDDLCAYGDDTLFPDVEDFPYEDDVLGMFNLNTEGEHYIMGYCLLRFDALYGEHGETDIDSIIKAKENLEKTLKEKYNYEGPIKVFIDGGCGY